MLRTASRTSRTIGIMEEEVKPRATTRLPDLIVKAVIILRKNDWSSRTYRRKCRSLNRRPSYAPQMKRLKATRPSFLWTRSVLNGFSKSNGGRLPPPKSRIGHTGYPKSPRNQFFRPPPIPIDATDRPKADQGLTNMIVKNPHRRPLEKLLFEQDQSSRVGIKFQRFLVTGPVAHWSAS